jgi:hypothetical protein
VNIQRARTLVLLALLLVIAVSPALPINRLSCPAAHSKVVDRTCVGTLTIEEPFATAGLQPRFRAMLTGFEDRQTPVLASSNVRAF